jgi:sarcosine oxidase
MAGSELIVAPQPEHPSVWLVGGGGGMFKHAPALAEYVRELLEDSAAPPQRFGWPSTT